MVSTRGQAVIDDSRQVSLKLEKLSFESFSRKDISNILEPFASRIEYFLKSVVFPDVSNRESLDNLIDRLSGLGLSQPSVEHLHALRRLYNRSKHDPDDYLGLQEVRNVVFSVTSALNEIVSLGMTAVNAESSDELKSVILVGFWDHYVAGEMEAAVFLPSDHWSGVSQLISTFHLPMSAWDALKPFLINHPNCFLGKDAVGVDRWNSFLSDGDFLNAGVWEGDVRELLLLLSSYNSQELEKSVLPFLARGSSALSVRVAVVCAAIDVCRGQPNLHDEEMSQRILERAKKEYGLIPSDLVNATLDLVFSLVASVDVGSRPALSGPAFRRVEPGTEVNQVVDRDGMQIFVKFA